LAIAPEPGAQGKIRSHGSVATSQIVLECILRKIAMARCVTLAENHPAAGAGEDLQVRAMAAAAFITGGGHTFNSSRLDCSRIERTPCTILGTAA
jgi:hypothetical protein